MISSELAFRKSAPLVRDIAHTRSAVVYPISGWNSSSNNITFTIPPNDKEWISSQFTVDMDFSVQKADGSDQDPGNAVAFTNLPIASFFSSVRLSLNGSIVEGLNNNWSLRTWISSILSMSYIAKQFYGKDLWKAYPDTPYKAQNRVDAENAGWRARRLLCGGSQWVNVLSPLPLNLASSGLSLPPGLPIEVTLVNAKDSERLLTGGNEQYIVQIHNIRLLVDYYTLSEQASSTLKAKLSIGPLPYPFLGCDIINSQTVPVGTKEIVATIISHGEIPELCLFGFLKTALTQPNYGVNEQDFQAEAVEFVQACVNGEYIPNDGLTMDFETVRGTLSAYESFTEVCRQMSSDGSASYAEWAGGNCLIPIRLAQHFPSLKYRTEKRTGRLTVKIRFKAILTEALNLYTFAIASKTLFISRDGSVSLSSGF